MKKNQNQLLCVINTYLKRYQKQRKTDKDSYNKNQHGNKAQVMSVAMMTMNYLQQV